MAKSQKAKAQEKKKNQEELLENDDLLGEVEEEETPEAEEETPEAEEEQEEESTEEEEVAEKAKAGKYKVAENEKHLFHVLLDKPHFNSRTGKKLTKEYVSKMKPKAFKQFEAKSKELGFTIKVLHKPK